MSANKSFSTETSNRYSRALFEVSQESNELDKVEADVKNFQALLNSSTGVNNFIKDPSKSKNQQIEVMSLICEKLGFAKNLKNFFLLLIEKRRIFYVKKIFNSFLNLIIKKKGEINASLISSKQLSETELDKITLELSNVLGSKLKFDFKVDKNLIGGLKIQLGSFMIDTSIKSKLKKYEQQMMEI